jgi:hypothetical protein
MTLFSKISNHLYGYAENNSHQYSNAFFKRFSEAKKIAATATSEMVGTVAAILLMGAPKLIGALFTGVLKFVDLFKRRQEVTQVTLLEKYDRYQIEINDLIARHPALEHVAQRQSPMSDVNLGRGPTWSTFFNQDSIRKYLTIHAPELAIMTLSALFGYTSFSMVAWTSLPFAGSYLIEDEKKSYSDRALVAKFNAFKAEHKGHDHPLNKIASLQDLEAATFDKKLEVTALRLLIKEPGFSVLECAAVKQRFAEIKDQHAVTLNDTYNTHHERQQATVRSITRSGILNYSPKVREILDDAAQHLPDAIVAAQATFTERYTMRWSRQVSNAAAEATESKQR